MNLSYYGYSVERHTDEELFLFDIRPFIKVFVGLNNFRYKNRFLHNEENLYLLNIKNNLYIFIITRSNEVIKKIKSTDHSISEITSLLKTDEQLGFASYVYIEKSFIGFAATLMAPRATVFANFVNEIFHSINIHDHKFTLHPFMAETTFADAMTMPFIGKSLVRVTKENKLYDDIRNFFSGTTTEFQDVDSFELTIKPKLRKNIQPAVKKIMQKIPTDGLNKFICSAKEEASGHLTDLYLVGNGMLIDPIEKSSDQEMYSSIVDKISSNDLLTEKIREHEEDEKFAKTEPSPFSVLRNPDAWSDRISNL